MPPRVLAVWAKTLPGQWLVMSYFSQIKESIKPTQCKLSNAGEHTSSNLVSWQFISVFRAIVHCKSPQAGIIKLEWCRGKLLKETRGERWFDGDYSVKTIRMETWRFMSKFTVSLAVQWVDKCIQQDLPRQFGRILTSKECNRHNILPVELAGSTLIKNTGNRCRLCGMPLTLRISQAFLSVRNRKITGWQA